MTEAETSAQEPPIPATGELAKTRPEAILSFCERVRFSGTLGFTADAGRGILPILNGVPEVAADDAALNEALDTFLGLETGHYTLTQLLPVLEGATPDGELTVRGSLEKFTPADLLRYCEGAGLTGMLALMRDAQRYVARYTRGELVSVTVDDEEGDVDLAQVFKWDRGKFEIRARSLFERDRKMSGPQDPMLKTLEVALAEIMDRSERGAALLREVRKQSIRPPSILRAGTLPFGVQHSGGTRTRPSNQAPPRPRSVLPPPHVDTTVKIFFRDKGPPAGPSATQHAAGRLGSESVPLDPASQKHAVVAVDAALAPTVSASDVASAPAPSTPAVSAVSKPATAPPVDAAGRLLTAAFAVVLAASAIAGLVMIWSLVH